MKKINYKSDFDFIMRLRDCKDPEKTVEWPEGDFEAVFWAGSKSNSYRAGRRGGVCENCFPTEDGGMHFVFDKHRLGVGTLKWEPHFELANVIYPDGKEDVYSKEPLGIELVDGPGDCPTTAEVEALVPFIRFKYEDLTDEEKAEISKPATDAAASVRELEKSVRAAENERVANETARIGAENARELAEQTRQTNEQDRTEAEALREVAEEERNDAEERRAEEFAGWEGEIDSKADRSELSNVLAEEPLDAGNFPGINTYTREELKKDLFIDMWNDAAKANPNNNYGRKKCGEYDPENAPDVQHPFRLYDVWLTYEEAVAIYNWRVADQRLPLAYAFSCYPWRAAMPLYRFRAPESLDGVFSNAVNLEYVAFYAQVTSVIGAFSGCRKLRKIDGHFSSAGLSAAKVDGMFRGCEALEEVRLYWFPSISFADSPNLSLASVEHYVANTSGSADKPKVLTLHPTAYARVTDELFETAASKNITIASA